MPRLLFHLLPILTVYQGTLPVHRIYDELLRLPRRVFSLLLLLLILSLLILARPRGLRIRKDYGFACRRGIDCDDELVLVELFTTNLFMLVDPPRFELHLEFFSVCPQLGLGIIIQDTLFGRMHRLRFVPFLFGFVVQGL